jgi:hypothetical protein
MKRFLSALFAVTLCGCRGAFCKSEEGIASARREAGRDNARAVEEATAQRLREAGATRLMLTPVTLRTTCLARTPPADGLDGAQGWREPLRIRCDDLRMLRNQVRPLEAVTASGAPVLLVPARVENAVTVGTTPDGRTLLFRAVPYPDRMRIRYVTQCGTCSGLSDAWAEPPPEVTTFHVFVLEGRDARSTSWVDFPYDGVALQSHCEQRPDE